MKRKNHLKTNQNGTTLAEIIVTMFVSVIGILGCLAYLASASLASMVSKDKMIAINHAEYVLEEMNSRASLASITGENWTTFASSNNLDTLNSEVITVAYADTSANPLDIDVTVTWNTRNREHSILLQTEITK